MRTHHPQPGRAPWALTLTGITVLLLGIGCSSDPGESPTMPLPDDSQSEEIVPSMDEIQTEVDLTPSQAAAVEPALAEWRHAVSAAEFVDDPLLEDSPAVTFLARAAGIVEAHQLGAVMRMVEQSAHAYASSLRPDPADRLARRHQGLRGLFRKLDLSPAQVALLKDAIETAHLDAAALCEDYLSGEITAEELFEGRALIREDLAEAIAEILTDEQEVQLEQNRIEILTFRLTRMLDRFDDRVEKRLARFDALLDLTDEQEATILGILTFAKPDLEALLADLEAGNLTAAEARDTLIEIRTATMDAVRAELTEDQLEILEKLQEMHEPCGGQIEA